MNRSQVSNKFYRITAAWSARAPLIIAAILSGVVGVLLLQGTHATTSTGSIESETGQLSGQATVLDDSTASNGAAVHFGPITDRYGLSTTYTVHGNYIKDAAGHIFVPHGVDRPSLEWNCTGYTADGGHGGIAASDFTTMHTVWKANIVRIALSQDFWLASAAQYCPTYQATVAAAIQHAHEAGLRVILDLHWSDAGNLANSGPCPQGNHGGQCVGQQCMADQNSVTFWQQVASQYKDDKSVWFELYNEPENISWDLWQNGGPTPAAPVCGASYQAVGMQALVDAVRGVNADNIVLAGGTKFASSLAGMPTLSGSNIVYAVHPYAATNPDTWSTGDWSNRFGTLAQSRPVVATEFGRLTCGASTYDQAVLDYFRTHGIGYTVWAWYAGGCRFPGVISSADGTCVEYGCDVMADLQKFADGSQTMTIPGITGPVATPLVP